MKVKNLAWKETKNRLAFADIDLIFKVTAVKKLKIHSRRRTTVFRENSFLSNSAVRVKPYFIIGPEYFNRIHGNLRKHA